jgi:hypothetical protein
MPDITHNSHYVPQATLRRWSDDGTHVHAYRILVSHAKVPEWKKLPIRRVTRQADLYTTLEGDQESDQFEKHITRMYEEPGQDAIEKLLFRQRMTPLDWNRIAKFVALQQMRTPLFFVEFVKRLNEQIPEILANAVKTYVERQEEHSAPPVSAQTHGSNRSNHLGETLRVSIQPSAGPAGETGITAEVSSARAAWLSTISSMLVRLEKVVCQHRWRVIEPADDAEWPLTDHPVLTLNYFRPDLYDFGAGWSRKGSEFVLPVSPRVAVCTQVGSNNHGPRTMTLQQTDGIQRFMAERALRWIIARPGAAEWVSSVRPRTVNADAFATEQEAWRRWHSGHTESEAEFRAGQRPAAT